jgi:hypothetical protein
MSMTNQAIEQTCEAIKAESKRLYAHQIHLDLADIRPFLKALVESLSAPSEPSDGLNGKTPWEFACGWYTGPLAPPLSPSCASVPPQPPVSRRSELRPTLPAQRNVTAWPPIAWCEASRRP